MDKKNKKRKFDFTPPHSWRHIRNEFGLWGDNKNLKEACNNKSPDGASFVIVEKLWEDLQKGH